MKLLSSFFKCSRDVNIHYTHYAHSQLKNSVCFVLTEEFLSIANNNKNIVAIITTEKLADRVTEKKGLLISDNPKRDFFNLHNALLKENLNDMQICHEIDVSANISNTAKIYDNVKIGKNVIIEDFVVIYGNTVIGDNTYIASNVVIGARGMHNTMIDGKFINVQDAGGVHIGKNCEILAGAIIQKAYFSEFTKIGDDTKISVGVKVGHGCIIGERTLVAGSAQLSGYSTIGNDVWIGPASVLAHGLNVGHNAQIKLGSVVVKDVNKNEEVSGNFAYKHTKRIRNFVKEQR